MSHVKDEAIVLRSYAYGEADRIVVMLTKSSGKVRAMAKGIRRPRSKLGGRLEPMSRVHVVVWKGRSDLGIVNQVDLLEGYPNVRGDLDRITGAMSVLEVADQLVQDDHEDERLFRMVGNVLATFNDLNVVPHLIAPAFFLKVLVAEGAGPEVRCCASCGSDGPLVSFALMEGGMLCSNCRRGRPVSAEALQVLQLILNGGLRSVLTEQPTEASKEVANLAAEAIEQHLDRRLRSLRTTTSW